MNETQHSDNPFNDYFDRYNMPNSSESTLDKQQRIARTLSRLIADRYWQELHEMREKNGK